MQVMQSIYAIPEDKNLHSDHQPIPDPVQPLPHLLASKAFQQWFQGSTVVTAAGEPLVVFHGTSRENREFRASRHYDLEGAYFTHHFTEAKAHAYMDSEIEGEQPYVIAAFIQLKRPYVMNDMDSHAISTQQANELKASGFDGVINVDKVTGEIGEYVVFDPAQIAQFYAGKIHVPTPAVQARKSRVFDDDPSP